MEERLECLPPAIRIAVAVRSIRRVQPLLAPRLEQEQQKRIEEFLRLAEVCSRGPDAAFVKGRKWLSQVCAKRTIAPAADPVASDFVRAANSAREAFMDADDANKSATAVAAAVQCSIAASTLSDDYCAATAFDADLQTAVAIADANIVWVDSGVNGPFGAYWSEE